MQTVRRFWVPSGDGRGWELVEARKAAAKGWELRRPGKFGARTVPEVPVPGEDWVEAEPPQRAPKPPAVQAKEPPKPKPAPVRVVVKDDETAAEQRPRTAPERPDRKAGARHTKPVPKLSRELMDLMKQTQLDQPAPPGKAKCPRCGAIVEPMKVRKVRTHDDPLTGQRCIGSGQPTS